MTGSEHGDAPASIYRRLRRAVELELARVLLPPLFRRKCGGLIPLGGPEAEALDCFSIHAFRDGEIWLWLRSADLHRVWGHTLVGKEFDKAKFVERAWEEIPLDELRIIHHFRGGSNTFNGIWDLAYGRLLPFAHLNLRRMIWSERLRRWTFNRRRLPRPRRLDVLRAIRDRNSERERGFSYPREVRFSSLDLMTQLYGERWVLHPACDSLHNDLELILKALLESGELAKGSGIEYEARGQSVVTLERLETEAKRDNTQDRYHLATIILAVLAIPGFWSAVGPFLRESVFPRILAIALELLEAIAAR